MLPDLDPVAAGSKVPHELSGPVQALPAGHGHLGTAIQESTMWIVRGCGQDCRGVDGTGRDGCCHMRSTPTSSL